MKKDVETREDLHQILRDFYSRLLLDKTLYPYFEKFRDHEVLEEHLTDLTDFWEGSLFYTGNYKKNVMEIHRRIDASNKLKTEHFKAWLLHFEQAVDKFFSGDNSGTLKSRARSIATVMQIKFQERDQ
jgi:hemoglobin